MEAEFQTEFEMKVCNGFLQQHYDLSVFCVFLSTIQFLHRFLSHIPKSFFQTLILGSENKIIDSFISFICVSLVPNFIYVAFHFLSIMQVLFLIINTHYLS